MSGLALCLSVLFLTGSLLSLQAPSHAEISTVAFDPSTSPPEEFKPQHWTIRCEREDGTQGVFRVSSRLTDQPAPIEDALPPQSVLPQEPPAPNLGNKTPETFDDPFGDPIGDPSLECGRLLTLLSLFGTPETSTP